MRVLRTGHKEYVTLFTDQDDAIIRRIQYSIQFIVFVALLIFRVNRLLIQSPYYMGNLFQEPDRIGAKDSRELLKERCGKRLVSSNMSYRQLL